MSQEILKQASNLMGESVEFDCLLRLTAHLKKGTAATAEDVVGFDHLVHWDGICYQFYAANPPLIGMTQPVPVPCPLGICCVGDYAIDYKQAVEIFHTGNWGSKFTSLVLSRPLTPEVSEPYWYFVSDLGITVIIGANTGKIYHP